jgi:hypothetical protein
VSQDPGKPVDIIKPPASGSKELDLAFIMDSTGSMDTGGRFEIFGMCSTVLA